MLVQPYHMRLLTLLRVATRQNLLGRGDFRHAFCSVVSRDMLCAADRSAV